MRIVKYIILFISILLFYCCNIDLKFKKEDLKWIEVYQPKDQLIFKSPLNYDTITISKIEIRNGKSDLLESSYNAIFGKISYTDLHSQKENTLLSILKSYPQQPTSATFKFKGDHGRIRDINSYPVSIKDIKNVKREGYLFKPFSETKPSFEWNEEYGVENANLKYFFWDKEYGVIQYETVKGEVFILDKFFRDGKNLW